MSSEGRKLNCWDFKKCGREPDGENIAECGVCPAATEKRLDGIHGGDNGGRACWVVAGTSCKGGAEGTFAKKYRACSMCDFYLLVRDEEEDNELLPTFTLLKLIEG